MYQNIVLGRLGKHFICLFITWLSSVGFLIKFARIMQFSTKLAKVKIDLWTKESNCL